MNSAPPIWTNDELNENAIIAATNFRTARLSPTAAWTAHYDAAMAKFEALFAHLGDLDPRHFTDTALSNAYKAKHGEAMRYLAGPPISDDDLKVIADVTSIAPNVLGSNREAMRKVFDVIETIIDPFRFPWVVAGRPPTSDERSASLLASSVLLAAQSLATARRTTGKNEQELQVKDYLRTLKFTEVPTVAIGTTMKGPGPLQFCAECQLGDRKADVVLRLHDTRLMAIECKVSNSSTNSVKRLNNDAAVKASYWITKFGSENIVAAAMLSGVFKTLNLQQAQKGKLTIFWAHDLEKLGDFIESTR